MPWQPVRAIVQSPRPGSYKKSTILLRTSRANASIAVRSIAIGASGRMDFPRALFNVSAFRKQDRHSIGRNRIQVNVHLRERNSDAGLIEGHFDLPHQRLLDRSEIAGVAPHPH